MTCKTAFIEYASPLPPPGARPKPRPGPKPKPKPGPGPSGPVTTLVVGEESGQVFPPEDG
jgi:hypothetical protein